jgi:hypothetical protein
VSSPETNTTSLVASLAPDKRSAAQVALRDLLEWTAVRSDLLRFHDGARDRPQVRFDTADGYVFWLARPTTDGDAKIELLTRTARDLPDAVMRQLRAQLQDLIESPSHTNGVLQVPIARVGDPAALKVFQGALDFALGAVTALRASRTSGDVAR